MTDSSLVAELRSFAAAAAHKRDYRPDLILLGGSMQVGLSQDSSDYDLFVISLAGTHSSLGPATHDIGLAFPVDIEFYSVSALQTSLLLLERTTHDLTTVISHDTLLKFSAIMLSEAIHDPDGLWPALRERMLRAYSERIQHWHAEWAERASGTSRFAMSIGDYPLFDAAMRTTVGHVLDLRLAERGELYYSAKYRFTKAQRAGCNEYWLGQAFEFATGPCSRDHETARKLYCRIKAWAAPVDIDKVDADVEVPMLRPNSSLISIGKDHWVIRGQHARLVVGDDVPLANLLVHGPLTICQFLGQGTSRPERQQRRTFLRGLSESGFLMIPSRFGRWSMWV